jgi:hypothetical protein
MLVVAACHTLSPLTGHVVVTTTGCRVSQLECYSKISNYFDVRVTKDWPVGDACPTGASVRACVGAWVRACLLACNLNAASLNQ